jgi:hypothetical protein
MLGYVLVEAKRFLRYAHIWLYQVVRIGLFDRIQNTRGENPDHYFLLQTVVSPDGRFLRKLPPLRCPVTPVPFALFAPFTPSWGMLGSPRLTPGSP